MRVRKRDLSTNAKVLPPPVEKTVQGLGERLDALADGIRSLPKPEAVVLDGVLESIADLKAAVEDIKPTDMKAVERLATEVSALRNTQKKAWKFDIRRDKRGRITEVVAQRIGDN